MKLSVALVFGNLFFLGILAGVELVIHYGLRRPAESLDERSQLKLRQALILRLRVLVPACFLPAAITALAVAVVERGAAGHWLRYVGLAALLIWILVRIVGTVPINSATIDWPPDAPPADWKAQIDNAERFHIVGVWVVVIAFALFLTAAALSVTAH